MKARLLRDVHCKFGITFLAGILYNCMEMGNRLLIQHPSHSAVYVIVDEKDVVIV